MWPRIIYLFLILFVNQCFAQEHQTLSVSEGYFSATYPMATSAAGYVILTNKGDDTLVLTGIQVSKTIADQASLHETIMKNDIVSMHPLKQLTLSAGKTLHFQPGGKHIMLTGLQTSLSAKDTVQVTFTFAEHGTVTETFSVKPVDNNSTRHNHHD